MGILQHEHLFCQRCEAEQQADGDKTGNQRGKNSGESGEKLLHAAGLLAFQRLFFLCRHRRQRRRVGRRLFQQ